MPPQVLWAVGIALGAAVLFIARKGKGGMLGPDASVAATPPDGTNPDSGTGPILGLPAGSAGTLTTGQQGSGTGSTPTSYDSGESDFGSSYTAAATQVATAPKTALAPAGFNSFGEWGAAQPQPPAVARAPAGYASFGDAAAASYFSAPAPAAVTQAKAIGQGIGGARGV